MQLNKLIKLCQDKACFITLEISATGAVVKTHAVRGDIDLQTSAWIDVNEKDKTAKLVSVVQRISDLKVP